MSTGRFDEVLSYGRWVVPGGLLYEGRAICCDRCQRTDIRMALHYQNVDLCEECIHDLKYPPYKNPPEHRSRMLSGAAFPKSKSRKDPLTYMVQNLTFPPREESLTLMMQDSAFPPRAVSQSVLTLMRQDSAFPPRAIPKTVPTPSMFHTQH